METIGIRRIQFLNVPVDCVDQENALRAVEAFLQDGQRHQLVFVDRRGLLRARHNPEFRRCLREASLVLPTSREIVNGARFLKEGGFSLFTPFTFVIRLLALAERLNRSVYLLGARKGDLVKGEKNLRDSFPGLRLVGRYAGYFGRDMEKNVLLAIKKASPSFLLVGNGLSAKDLWILRHKKELNPGIYLWAGDCFDLFSGKKKSAAGGLTAFLRQPWRVLFLFSSLYFWLLLLVRKAFKL